ncbi:hypothetical protein S7711_10381 [Stachybotrys chartarum IBT 7711]|uniref:Uncharacterized protein n=1 Tax=Stachybotrys chartarum (strain CBS 109288 / IBT 7711) TaxID=1280523 RepID=A0A084AU42_STACB|nr:hypothetical protein S7711_10381 [Stachybotrys chartarum IBT 7711]
MSAIPNSTISGLALVGWKMGELLPYLSPAMTGGGVSKNLFKVMPPAAPPISGAIGSPPSESAVSISPGRLEGRDLLHPHTQAAAKQLNVGFQ